MVYRPQNLDATFGALADPTRRAILVRLSTGPRTISELASGFDMTLPAVSKHVRVLEHAGLASLERHGRARRATLSSAPMRGALEWIERYRRFWESELDQLAVYLESQEPPCRTTPRRPRSQSKSAAASARRASASSTRGRNRKN
jgi:DNA-binding transcriptional ArsR family regulator